MQAQLICVLHRPPVRVCEPRDAAPGRPAVAEHRALRYCPQQASVCQTADAGNDRVYQVVGVDLLWCSACEPHLRAVRRIVSPFLAQFRPPARRRSSLSRRQAAIGLGRREQQVVQLAGGNRLAQQ